MRKRMAFALIKQCCCWGDAACKKVSSRPHRRRSRKTLHTSMVYQLFLVYGGLGRESGVQDITDKTGVNIDFVVPSGDESEI